MFDLGPAAQEMNRLLAAVRDDQLTQPTPCPDWTVADLLAHVHQFATVFTLNARKEPVELPGDLPGDWRTVVPQQVQSLVTAWKEESAWTGRVSAGGVEMDAADNALVAIEEFVVHGWDLARSTGQDFGCAEPSLDRVDQFFELFAEPIASGQGPYGPAVPAPDGADRLERTIAHTGRDPFWSSRG
jgi:uncharacterized protein (TIGR03086 family)